jgi:hypothetical protein
MLRVWFSSLSLFVALAAPGAAWAQAVQPPGTIDAVPPRSAPAPETRTVHYGLHVAGADAAALVGGIATGSGEVFLGGYLLGGPIVHAAHGSPGRALGSLGLRVGLPLAGGVIVGATAGDAGLEEVALGLLAGMVTASVVDATVLARKEVASEKERRDPALLRVGRVSGNPNLGVSLTGDLSLGVAGTF